MKGLEDEEFEILKDRLNDSFSDYYELAGGSEYRYHHLVRTHRYVKKLVERPEISKLDFDLKVLEVASLLHDIGRKEDIEDGFMDPIEAHEGHAETGEKIVGDFIEDILSEKRVKEVKKIIGNHHSAPDNIETKILQDADTLGFFGPMNIWRMIHYASDKERDLDETFEYFWGEGRRQKQEKLESLNFECSERIARKRIQRFEKMMNIIEEEHYGEDI